MSTHIQIEFERFLESVADLSFLWQSIDIRVLAIELDRQWHNLASICYMDYRSHGDVPKLTNLPVTRHVAAWQKAYEVDALGGILDAVGGGELTLDSEVVHYLTNQSSDDVVPYRSWHHSFLSLSNHNFGDRSPWAIHQLVGTGDPAHSLISRLSMRPSDLDNSLRALQHPFDGLEGLARTVIGEATVMRSGNSAIFKAVAPILVKFDVPRCRFEAGVLHFVIIAEAPAVVENCSVGFVALRQDETHLTDSTRLVPGDWTTRGDKLVYAADRQFPDVRRLTILLRVGKHSVDKATLIDPAAYKSNPRVQAYSVFDPGLELLEGFLKPETPAGGSRFERAIARLLTLVGFQVDLLAGDRLLTNAVDLISYAHASKVILAVECTTGSIDAGGKLGKLVARARNMAIALPKYEIIPVLVTSIDRRTIAEGELRQAAADRIALVTQEDISELLLMVGEGVLSPTQFSSFDPE